MKKLLISLLTAGVLLSGCGLKTTITSGDLQLLVNSEMQVKVKSLNETTKDFYSDYVSADALIGEEFKADRFALKSINSVTDSLSTVHTLVGVCKNEGYEIEKVQIITAYKSLPDFLQLETYYVNKGEKAITVKALQSNALRVTPEKNDTLIWSFQPTSSNRRADWILPLKEGFSQENFLGMNNSDYGGGIPMVDIWRKDGGLAVGLTEATLKQVSMPVEWVRYDDYASMGLRWDLKYPVDLKQNDTIASYGTFIAAHTGDYYNVLEKYSKFMQQERGISFPEPEPEAFEAVWCAWGYERMFTIQEVVNTLDKVKDLGFKWVDVDDGFQIAEGDWETNSRFPGGDKDMRRITDEIHKRGLKAKLWWAPLAADPGTNVLKNHPEVQLKTEEWAPQYITWWDSYYMSPVNPHTELITNELLERFLVKWNFDGLKLDGQHLNCCQPDYNEHSNLEFPEQSVELLPSYFENVYSKSREYKSFAVVQNCPCGCAINFFNTPFMNQAVASDPTSSWQIRLKGKTYRAISKHLAYYADHVELSDNGNDFATQIGIGGVIGSKFTYPRNNPNVKEDYLLTPEKEIIYKKWVSIYNEKMLSKGEYLNLYDIAYDFPEAHVISKDGGMYYAFYAPQFTGEIELRGLDKSKRYSVCEYTSDNKKIYSVDGSHPVITVTFTGNYLIEVKPLSGTEL